MWNYVRTTRIAVPDIQDVITKENRSMDKVQALFADMEERASAWKELSELKELELVGSLSYNIEITPPVSTKEPLLLLLAKCWESQGNPLWHAETVTTMSIFSGKSVLA